jgi:Na+/melibiose symporter-like transporter
LLALRIFVSFIPAVILLSSFIVVHNYPINRQKHAALLAELKLRKQHSSI